MEEQMIGITYINYYIPEEELLIADLLNSVDTAYIPPTFKNKEKYARFIENALKLKSIRIETRLDEAAMIGACIEKMLAEQPVKAEDIDIIISPHEPDYVTHPNLAKFLQFKYKMNNAYVINVTGNYCANIEVAVHLAQMILHGQQDINNILIVASNRVEKLEKRIFGAYAIYGDAASALLISRNSTGTGKYRLQLKDKIILTNPALYNADVNEDQSIVHCIGYVKCISDLIKKGPPLSTDNCAASDKKQGEERVCQNNQAPAGTDKKSPLTNNHIEKILVQNANPLMITQCMASAGLDKNKIFTKNIGRYGHMNFVDFPINLKDILDEGITDKDRYILTFGTGHTGTYVVCLFKSA